MNDDSTDSSSSPGKPNPPAEELPGRREGEEPSPAEVVVGAGANAEADADPKTEPDIEEKRSHLLKSYDRIRERVLAAVEDKGGRLGGDVVRALLLVPDIFLLLVRMALDKEVPTGTRALIASVLAYFIMPLDFLPEAVIGGAGYLDDIVLATALLAQIFDGELEPYAIKHWSGPDDLRTIIKDVSTKANQLVGSKTHGRLQKMLGKLLKDDPKNGPKDAPKS